MFAGWVLEMSDDLTDVLLCVDRALYTYEDESNDLTVAASGGKVVLSSSREPTCTASSACKRERANKTTENALRDL